MSVCPYALLMVWLTKRTSYFDVPILINKEVAELEIQMEKGRLEAMKPIHTEGTILSDLDGK